MSYQCQGYTRAGHPCKMHAGSDAWCFNHRPGPEAEAERLEAASRGGKVGKARTLAPEDVEVRFDSAQAVTGLLASICQWVLTGQVDPKTANAAVYAAGTALRGLDQGDIEQQLAELRAEIEKLKGLRVAV